MHRAPRYGPRRACADDGLPLGQGWFVNHGASPGTNQVWCQAGGRRLAVTDATVSGGLEAEPAPFALAVRAGGRPLPPRDRVAGAK
jgi:hypothetical protein